MNRQETKVFIGGLSWETTDQRLRSYFENFGIVQEAFVSYDRHTGKPRGFGFVVFADPIVADRVTKVHHTIDRREVEAKRALPKDESPPSKDSHSPSSSTISPPGSTFGGNNSIPAGTGQVNPSPTTTALPSLSNDKTRKIFVGGLPPTMDECSLRSFFAEYGIIEDAVVMYDHEKARPRGFGFITFTEEEAVDRVFAAGPVYIMHQKQVEVKRAVPKEAMPPTPSSSSKDAASHGPPPPPPLSFNSPRHHQSNNKNNISNINNHQQVRSNQDVVCFSPQRHLHLQHQQHQQQLSGLIAGTMPVNPTAGSSSMLLSHSSGSYSVATTPNSVSSHQNQHYFNTMGPQHQIRTPQSFASPPPLSTAASSSLGKQLSMPSESIVDGLARAYPGSGSLLLSQLASEAERIVNYNGNCNNGTGGGLIKLGSGSYMGSIQQSGDHHHLALAGLAGGSSGGGSLAGSGSLSSRLPSDSTSSPLAAMGPQLFTRHSLDGGGGGGFSLEMPMPLNSNVDASATTSLLNVSKPIGLEGLNHALHQAQIQQQQHQQQQNPSTPAKNPNPIWG